MMMRGGTRRRVRECLCALRTLRVCYEEYSPLRFGGDLIFRVLKRVVAATLGV